MEFQRIQAPAGSERAQTINQANLLTERLGAALRIAEQLAGKNAFEVHNQPVTEKAIRNIIKLRRNRDRVFDADLFADPAWDMLLELYASHLGQQRISVSSLCHCSGVPPTTALRWITTLDQRGLIERRQDPTDGRRYFVSLTVNGRELMERYFRTVPVAAAPV